MATRRWRRPRSSASRTRSGTSVRWPASSSKQGETPDRGGDPRAPRAAGGQVVAARRRRVHRRGAQDQRRQVLEEDPARALRRLRAHGPRRVGPGLTSRAPSRSRAMPGTIEARATTPPLPRRRYHEPPRAPGFAHRSVVRRVGVADAGRGCSWSRPSQPSWRQRTLIPMSAVVLVRRRAVQYAQKGRSQRLPAVASKLAACSAWLNSRSTGCGRAEEQDLPGWQENRGASAGCSATPITCTSAAAQRAGSDRRAGDRERAPRRHRAPPALQVSAHQSGSSITTESSRRWPAGLWPAEIGAPRRSRTYNPLAGSRVIRWPPPAASLLVTAVRSRFRSCPAMAAVGSCPGVSDDQSGDLIMSDTQHDRARPARAPPVRCGAAPPPRAGHETGGPRERWASNRGPFMVKRAAFGSAGPLPAVPNGSRHWPPTWVVADGPVHPADRADVPRPPTGCSCLTSGVQQLVGPSGFRQLQVRALMAFVSIPSCPAGRLGRRDRCTNASSRRRDRRCR